MKREDSLDALVAYDSAHGEGFVNSTAPAGNYGAGEYLNAFFVAFFDPTADIYDIAYFEMRYIGFEAFCFDSV